MFMYSLTSVDRSSDVYMQVYLLWIGIVEFNFNLICMDRDGGVYIQLCLCGW